MKTKYLLKTLIPTLLIGILLAACRSSSEEITTMTASSWTATPTKTLTPVPTATLLPTDTPTPTSTQTNTPPPPTPTHKATETLEPQPTAEGGSKQTFQFKDQEFHISGAHLNETYSTALKRAGGEDPLAERMDEKQPVGTNCLILTISIYGIDKDEGLEAFIAFQTTGKDPTGRFKALMELGDSIIVDENYTIIMRDQEKISLTIRPDGIVNLFLTYFPLKEATSFTLILPDGQKIALSLFE
jgi:hypothetical protein